jgi:hypothetical protein
MDLLMADELTKLQAALLKVLTDRQGEWTSRKGIARLLGRKGGLTHYDVQQLKKLEDLGLIESREVTFGVVMTGYEYKAL